MLTESEAWRVIGEAFEARAAHPDLDVDDFADLSADGFCTAMDRLQSRGKLPKRAYAKMDDKVWDAVDDPANGGTLFAAYIQPYTTQTGGSELRATLAYLFAEEAAA